MAKPSSDARHLDDVGAFTVAGKAGDLIFREGEAGAELYVVLDGRVEILKQWVSDQRQIEVKEPGDFFGESSLLERSDREASARALTDYRLLRIDNPTFDELVRECPAIAVQMLRKLSQRARERLEADTRAASVVPLKRAARGATKLAAVTRQPGARAVLVDERGREFSLAESDELIIGRVDRASGKRPHIDLTDVDTDKKLSRRHARIVRRDGDYFVREEAGAPNGSFLNGTRLTSTEEAKLGDGDELRFAVVVMRFQYR